ncbi:non-canonical purine NTP pyrophosphatase [Nitratifractor sp.]
MQWVLASGNKGKIREFREIFGDRIVGYDELIAPFEVEESASTFAGNALLKARAVYERLGENPRMAVLADDSGISVPALGGVPGIYSARYAGEGASDRENLRKLIGELEKRGIERTPAYYTAAIAIVSPVGEYVVHGWMHGEVIPEARGEGGFGYDPMFIPEGFTQTLGELDSSVKQSISHRYRAAERARPLLDLIERSLALHKSS